VEWRGLYSAGYLIEPLEIRLSRDGIARAIFQLNYPGEITFSAKSGLASSKQLTLEIVAIPTATHTPAPTNTPTETATNAPSPTPALLAAVATDTPIPITSTPAIATNTPIAIATPVPFFQSPAGVATIGAVATIIASLIGLLAVILGKDRLPIIGTKAGYRRRLKILYNNLNHLKEQEALVGPIDISLKLANEIQLIEEEIAELEKKLEDE
jgi:hypothetical protein